MLGKMLNVVEVFKAFEQGGKKIKVLESLNLSVANGEKVAILGQSGSGKSTLLTLLAGLDHPDSGSISINNQNLSSFKEDELSKFRSKPLKFHEVLLYMISLKSQFDLLNFNWVSLSFM